jgi:hypothetical protein
MKSQYRYLEKQYEEFELSRLVKTREPQYAQFSDPHPDLTLWDVITVRNEIKKEMKGMQKPN